MPSSLLLARACTLALSAGIAVAASAASCSDKGSSSSSGDTTSTSAPVPSVAAVPARGSGHQYGPPTGKIRVANLLEIDGKPYGPLDLYDAHTPDSADVPLIKHLDYGQVSDYVSPRAEGPYSGAKSFLFIFPAGQKTATRPFGSLVEQSGWEAADRVSIALGPSKDAGGNATIAIVSIAESGKRLSAEQADTATKIQGSGGLLVVREANVRVDSLPELYLSVDGSCPHAPNDLQASGDSAKYKLQPSSISATMFFPIAPGTHTLGVVSSKRGTGLQSCNGLTPVGTTSVTVEAGRRYMVWVFGQPSDGFKVIAAPIATQ